MAEQGATAEVAAEHLASRSSSSDAPQPKKSLVKSLRKLLSPSQAAAPTPLSLPQSTLLTPSEPSEDSFCSGDHNVQAVENSQDSFDSSVTSEGVYDNVEDSLEDCGSFPSLNVLNSDSSDHLSSRVFHQMDEQVAQLVQVLDRALTMQRGNNPSKLVVSFPVFRGDESEDVHEFITNYKRAARLNGWNEENLALGLPLYLKGHASAWFKTLEAPDEMTFEDLCQALTEHFASGASEWRVRQALSKRRQLENEPVADYSYSLRMHCAKLDLPRSEWTHYFVHGLRPEIREYVVLQQPENLAVAENFAKLKESVLTGSEKQPAIDAKKISAQIVEELSKNMPHKDKTVNALGQQSSSISKSDVQQMIRAEFQQLANRPNFNAPNYNQFRKRRGPVFPARGFRSRTGVPICFSCGRRGHTYYNCRTKPDPRVPRQNNVKRFGNPRQHETQSNYTWAANQGN